MTDELRPLADYIGGLIASMSPAQRRKMAMKIAIELRKRNADRIARNEDPDGRPFAPRKNGLRGKEGRVKRKAAMFTKLRSTRHLTRKATADGAQIGFFKGSTARIARVHQFGEEDRVSRSSGVRARYAQRRLLGFNQDDDDRVMEIAIDHLT